MAKTQILDYYIHLTDKALVDKYNDQLATISTVTNSPDGVGSPLLFIPATGKFAILRAPDGAATEFSAPKQAENVTFSAPCTRSHWFVPGTNNFPTNVATFTRKSGGWFGISALFGKTTKFYWAGHFVYAPSTTQVIDGNGVVVTTPSLIPKRRFIDGFEMPAFGEGAAQYVSDPDNSPDAARVADGGFGFAHRQEAANQQNVRHQIPPAPATHTSWERFYVRVRKLPAATRQLWQCENFSQSGSGFRIHLQPGGQLAFFSSPLGGDGDLAGTGGQLTVGVWVRIDCLILFKGIAGVPDVNHAHLEVYLNGTRVGQFSMTPAGLVGNVKHIDSYIGRTQVVGSTGEVDFDDWMQANSPSNVNTLNADWNSGTSYAIGDIVNWDPATPLGFGIRLPSNVRGFTYKALTANTNKQPDLNGTDWAPLGDSPDWLLGSHMVVIRATGLASDASGWTGDFRKALQRPHGGFDEEITSTTPSARFSVTTDAADVIGKLRGARGIAGFGIGDFSNRSAVAGPNGQVGFRLNGGALSIEFVNQADPPNDDWVSTGPAGEFVPIYQPSTLAAPQAVTALELVHDRDSNATGTASLRSLHAVAEVLGIFGPEDVPPGTDIPPFPILRTGIHNRWYPRSPWAQNTSRGHSPVVLHAGTYAGNGVGSDLTFRVPPHLLFIRRVVTVGSRTAHWWASMLGSHIDFAEAIQPGAPVYAEVDPTFVPVGGEDDQAQRYRVRLLSDIVVNDAASTYQYFAICDPAARFMLTGAFSHADTAALPITEPIADVNFTPEAGLVWAVTRSLTTTSRAYFKGIGHAANELVRLLGGVLTNALTFAAGVLTLRADLIVGADFAQFSYALFRREDGNLDPDAKNILSLLSYTGDGAASKSLTFSPSPTVRPLYAIVVADSGGTTVHRDPSHTGTSSTDRITNNDISTGITAGGIGTITVGSSLNTNGVAYNVLVFWGGTAAGNNGWSQNGEFIPVEPESNKPPSWAEPEERIISFAPPPAPPVAGQPDLDTGTTAGSTNLGGTGTLGSSTVNVGGLVGGQPCEFYTRALVNIALSRLGVSKTILNLATDNTEEAVIARKHVLEDVNQVLRDVPWPFATRYESLVLVGGTDTVPVNNDWQYSYRAPNGMMFARRIAPKGQFRKFEADPIDFRIGSDSTGPLIFCNEKATTEIPLVLEWTARLTCPAFYGDALFRDALAWRFAASLAQPIARDSKKQEFCLAMYRDVLERAKVDAVNEWQPPNDVDGEAEWIAGR